MIDHPLLTLSVFQQLLQEPTRPGEPGGRQVAVDPEEYIRPLLAPLDVKPVQISGLRKALRGQSSRPPTLTEERDPD